MMGEAKDLSITVTKAALTRASYGPFEFSRNGLEETIITNAEQEDKDSSYKLDVKVIKFDCTKLFQARKSYKFD